MFVLRQTFVMRRGLSVFGAQQGSNESGLLTFFVVHFPLQPKRKTVFNELQWERLLFCRGERWFVVTAQGERA